MTKLDVSIIVPVKNGEPYIRETLESIANQTYRSFEVIVIDDGSTDRTTQLVEDFAKRYPRFRLEPNRGGQGHEHARNVGVSLARGSWIAECDADDSWHPEKLARQIRFVNEWDHALPLVAVGTAGYNINAKGKVVSRLDAQVNTIDQFLETRAKNKPIILHHSSVLYDKACFLAVGGYKYDYVGAEDTELFSRMAEHGAVLNMPDPLFYYRKHMGSFSLAKNTVQTYNFWRIEANIERRRKGLPELGYEEFVTQLERNWSKREKKHMERMLRGKYLYRVGAVHSANGRYVRGLMYLALASFYDRSRVLSGIRRRIRGPLATGSPS